MGGSNERDELGDTIDAAARPSPVTPASAPEDLDAAIPIVVDRRSYIIDGEIAKGGMGRVLSARDRRLGRAVAIKELLPRNRDAMPRFELEARITARLQHPSIIHVYEAGRWPDGESFYAMPRIRGRSLDKVVAEKRTFAARMALLPNVIAVADALAYAHSQGVIHRDLKPANVLIGDFGETVVIDWGLAKDLRAPADPAAAPAREVRVGDTVAGSVVGTPAYMPPEQARGEPVDERADVYALGALLYHVLVGEPPYRGPTSAAVVDEVLARRPPPIPGREPGAPADLVAVVERAMARDPDRRYRSAGDLAQDLKRFQTGQMVMAHEYSVAERLGRWFRRRRGVVAVAALAAIVLVVVAAVSLRRVLAEKDRAEERRAALLEERGRTELLDGHAGRALVYLHAAKIAGRSGGTIDFLVADALRPFDALISTLDARGPVRHVTCSPDGRHVASAGDNGVTIWRLEGDVLERELAVGAARVVEYGVDGTIVTGGDDGVVRLWDPGGAPVRELFGHRGAIRDAELTADGRRLVSGDDEGVVILWDARTGGQLAALREHDGAVNAVSFDPEGRHVVTAGDDAVAYVWAPDLASVWPLRGHAAAIGAARFSPDGRRVATASADHRAVVWDPDTGKQLFVLGHDAAVLSIAFAPDGGRLVTASADHTARLWALASDDPAAASDAVPIATLVGHADIVIDAVFDRDGRRIATASRDRAIRIWDALSGDPIVAFEGHADLVAAVAFTGDGRVVSGGADGLVKVWRSDRSMVRRVVDVGDEIRGLAATSDGRTIATGTPNGELLLWREPFVESTSLGNRHGAPVTAIAISERAQTIVSGDEDGVTIVSQLDGTRSVRLEAAAPVLAVAVSATAGLVATASGDGAVRLWELDGGRAVGTLAGDGPIVQAIAFSADGARLVTGDDAGRALVWDVAARQRTDGPGAVADAVYAVGFSPDARRVVAGGDGDTPIIWTAATGASVPVEGPTGVVTAVAFTGDGSRVVTGGIDGVLGIWDALTGRLLAVRRGHRGPLVAHGLAVTDDGSTVITASVDRTIRVWDVDLDRRSASRLGELIERRVPWRLDARDQVARITAPRRGGR